jgi:hypothetical protein
LGDALVKFSLTLPEAVQRAIWKVRYRSLAWAFSKNKLILRILMVRYPPNHNYWKYLDQLISELKAAKCDGIREKIVDIANNSNKFNPTMS